MLECVGPVAVLGGTGGFRCPDLCVGTWMGFGQDVDGVGKAERRMACRRWCASGIGYR